MHLPKVTIVIPFYNCPYIEQAIQSALNQTYPNIEIVVVDDGSTRHAERIQPYAHKINYIGKANGGTASALNYGIRISSGEYFAWLSSDDLFYPHKIARQMEYMLARNAQISYTSFDLINEYNAITGRHVATSFRNVIEFYSSLHNSNPINGCTVIMKKQTIEALGYFDENLPFTHDYDLWLRAILTGYDFHYIHEPLTLYRWHSNMGTMRHRPAIDLEVAATRSRYKHSLEHYLYRLTH
ncbi:glycosyl transferase [Paenibacillus swuensis]|uniref:Glycosyl transferase n=1 Tax=Paenibacillus swuensis TaxID=1178515 RepID=A0A172TGA4_9BACL|nr:glycosyltransferase [Paenibacillus swuensis]ANE46089.1 glycosyl transferase [Paenibacillus swuensis]